MTTIFRTSLIGVGLTLLTAVAQAKPEYAKKENKACGYCHVKEEGGGRRNMRGVYYAMHNHTFEGFKEGGDAAGVAGATSNAPAKKTGTPAFKMAWSATAPEGTKRIGIGAVGTNGAVAVVSLSGDKITVSKIGDDALIADGVIEGVKDASKFVVGTFAKGKPASIVVPGMVYYRDGDKFASKAAKDISNITGHVKFADGTENIFYFEGAAPEVYSVDPTADKPVSGGKEMVPPDQGAGVYSDITVHPPVELLAALGVPEEGQKTGVIGMFDPRAESKIYVWMVWNGKDGKNVVAVAEGALGGGAEIKPVWTSAGIEGKVLDAAYGKDPKNPKVSGILVLTSSGEGGKVRKLTFYALD